MFKREFKYNLKSLILWSLILLFMYIVVFLVYPSLMNDTAKQGLDEMMNSMPKEMLSSFNMDIVGIETAFGWFKTEGYTFLTLIGALYSAILGSTILLKEENDKTIDFLYSKPVSRNKIVTSKILCGCLNILIFTLIITIGNYIGLNNCKDFKLNQYLMISLLPMLLYYIMFFVMLFISTNLIKTKVSMTIGLCIVFISYIMQIIGSMGDSIKFMKDISLFEFVSSRYIILNNSININYLLIGIGIIILSIIFTYKKYNKKEFI